MQTPTLDLDALLCALVLAPGTYARNRFFALHQAPGVDRVRRRASRLRGMLRQLTGSGRAKAEVVGEQVMADGRVLLRYQVPALGLTRSTSLSAVEAATLRFALHRAGVGPLSAEERRLVERTLLGLGDDVARRLTADEGDA